ncbi:MAG: hypothetical protein V4510_06380 [bacterium]
MGLGTAVNGARPILATSLWGLLAGVLLAAAGVFASTAGVSMPPWSAAHGWLLVVGFLMPGLAFLQFQLLERYMGLRLHRDDARILAGLYGWAAALITMGQLFPDALRPAIPFAVLGFAGFLLLAGTGMAQLLITRRLLPGSSVVDVARDPLSKGDDACLAQVRFAHFMLPAGLLLLALSNGPGLTDWVGRPRLGLAGTHVVLAGYGLLSVYAVSHLVVPRLARVPAIAAGAIKGELHSTLLGIVLLAAGFLSMGTPASTGLLIAGGVFLFFGAFVFMGVLGANIMKNKSPTQRVTPEFAYIPWTFAGVFWLIAGVLLGIFLNAVPALFADRLPALRFAHIHGILYGGFAILLMGYATRTLSEQPVPFRRTRWAFYAANVGLILMIVGELQAGPVSATFRAGALLAALGVAAWFISLGLHRMDRGIA